MPKITGPDFSEGFHGHIGEEVGRDAEREEHEAYWLSLLADEPEPDMP